MTKDKTCEYCNGNEKQLQTQLLSDTNPDQVFIEPYGVPAICICVNGEWIYLTIHRCPMCGRNLDANND